MSNILKEITVEVASNQSSESEKSPSESSSAREEFGSNDFVMYTPKKRPSRAIVNENEDQAVIVGITAFVEDEILEKAF